MTDPEIEKYEKLRIEEKVDPEIDKTVDLEIREKEGCVEALDPETKRTDPEIKDVTDPEIETLTYPRIVEKLEHEAEQVVELEIREEEENAEPGPPEPEDVGAAAAGAGGAYGLGGTRVSLASTKSLKIPWCCRAAERPMMI